MAGDLSRPVNVQKLDVGLTVIFRNKTAHEEYLKSEKHLQFIKQNKARLKKVRVYETYVRQKILRISEKKT